MTEEVDRCGHNVVVQNGKEGGLRVHRNVPYKFATTLSCFFSFADVNTIICDKQLMRNNIE